MKEQELLNKLREIGIDEVLSPTKKASERLKVMLPDPKLQLSDDTRHFYHLETDSFVQLQHTVQLACPDSVCISFDDFRKELLIAKSAKKVSDLTLEDFRGFLLEYKWLKNGKSVFVYLSFMDTRATANYTEYYRIMELFSLYCGEKRYEMDIRMQWDASDMFDEQQIRPYNMLFFVSYGAFRQLPDNLKASSCLVAYPPLEAEDFNKLIWEYYGRRTLLLIQSQGKKNQNIADLGISSELLEWYKNQMAGFGERTVRVLLSSIESNGLIPDYTDKSKIEPGIVRAKSDVLKQSGRLELIPLGEKKNNGILQKDITGLETISNWIDRHSEAIRNNVNAPTGILLVGIPGTGKSATAKMVARKLDLPLVQLDMSRILGGRVGDSEKGMREMLDDLRFAAPCVLWIDEIEKAMSGADGKSGDGGTIRRLFGMLLTFIQENDRPVFTVTTANDVSKLPPEFFRNGRFDQTFCLMMPNYKNCCEIMSEKLQKYLGVKHSFAEKIKGDCFDVCVGTIDNPRFLTGADIEAHVKEIVWQIQRDEVQFAPESYTEEELKDKIIKLLEEASKNVRAQASPAAKQSMETIANSYILMIEQGFTMAGSEKTPFIAKNLDLEEAQSFSFDPKEYDDSHKKYPETTFYCLKDPEDYPFNNYKLFKNPGKNTNAKPSEWYDAVFYYELAKAMGQVILFDKERTMEDVRRDYWKLVRKRRENVRKY